MYFMENNIYSLGKSIAIRFVSKANRKKNSTVKKNLRKSLLTNNKNKYHYKYEEHITTLSIQLYDYFTERCPYVFVDISLCFVYVF